MQCMEEKSLVIWAPPFLFYQFHLQNDQTNGTNKRSATHGGGGGGG